MPRVNFGFTSQQLIEEGRINQTEIDLLETWLSSQSIPELTDEQMALFLLACCKDQEATKTTIKSFYSVRKGTPELFNDRRLQRPDLQKQLKTLYYCVSPERTDDGCAVIFHGLQDPVYSNYEMGPALTLLFMTLEAAFYDHPPKGLIIVYDMKGASLMHLTRAKFGLLLPYCRYLQECLPVRGKAVHVLNTVYFIDKIMSVFKPFLTLQLKDLLYLHKSGADMEQFSEDFIPKRCLPADYGGDLPSIRVLHELNIKKLQEMESYFEAEELQRRNVE